MILTIPDNVDDFFKQIWKIIGLQRITKEDLIYYICYKMNLPYRPTLINKKIKEAIENGHLVELKTDSRRKLTISKKIRDELRKENDLLKIHFSSLFPIQCQWDRIEDNIDPWMFSENNKDKSKDEFKTLLKEVFSPGEINNGARVELNRIKYKTLDDKGHIIDARIDGSKKGVVYVLKIDINNRKIIHNCDDFIRNRINKKQMCKHFFKTIANLKSVSYNLGIKFLKSLKKGRDKWEFVKSEENIE
ncbi:MAG: hypothetical protein ACTSWY_10650 [Promethearchaeota archaeon]